MYLFILLSIILPCVQGEMFTSMAEIEQMGLFEKRMLVELNKYILVEEKKIEDIKNFLSSVTDVMRYVNASEDIGKYLGNPVNSYLMLKRFNVDWKKLEKTLEVDVAESLNTLFESLRPFFPTSEDHEGAMDALFRLQTIYNLQSSSLANGVIPGVSQLSIQPLNIQDIFELGIHAYKKRYWPHAIQWLSTALEKLGDRDIVNNIDKSDVLDYLAYAWFQFGDLQTAITYTAELSKLRPYDERIVGNLAYFQGEVKRLESSKQGNLVDEVYVGGETTEGVQINKTVEEMSELEMKNYEKLCRGESRNLTMNEQRRLKCWYKQNNPVLRLKPQKVERLWVTPEILLFHDIIREKQSKWIKETAYPLLQRAKTRHPITGNRADYRVCKSAWLSPKEHLEVQKLRIRAEAVTGLDFKYAEELQVANYGIGGHYEPHFDHAHSGSDNFTYLNMGNRIATLLFYISDVKAGGTTVFTNAHATVYPVRNAAVFWFNLKRNGEGNNITRHAACPVLVGQKWVSNWWVHEYGQDFRRRCALNKNW